MGYTLEYEYDNSSIVTAHVNWRYCCCCCALTADRPHVTDINSGVYALVRTYLLLLYQVRKYALFVRVSMCPSMCVLCPVDANVAAVSEAPRPRVCYTLKPVLLKPVFLPVDTHRNPTCLLHTRWSSPLSHHFYPSTPTLTNPTCLLHTQQCSSR